MKTIKATDYAIVFERKSHKLLGEFIKKTNYSSIYILVDSHTEQHCLPIFLSKFKYKYQTITIPAGEEFKNLETCAFVWDRLSELKADRKSIIINIGGGMLTDIGGFIASTFKRGIHFINVSTSLLGMVDASVGGKTGVDFNGLKNQIGLFANPKMVLIDTRFLKTLPKRELISGMAEIIKYGLSYDVDLWNDVKAIKNIHNFDMSQLIHRSIEIKNEVVTKDPKEKNVRKILNYGHTIGHAVETYFLQSSTLKTLTHGEAIAIGLVCETYISSKLYNFSTAQLNELKKYIKTLFGNVIIKENDFKSILDLMKHDKKNINGEVKFVLLNEFTDYRIDCKVEEKLIIEALNYYLF